MITRKNQLLLRFLKIRVIINGNVIYPLEKGKPIIVPLQTKHAYVVATDGFHFTKPHPVVYSSLQINYLKVVCTIDDEQLVLGFVLLALLYAAGFTSNLVILKLMSFIPILYFLFLYYWKRHTFIQLKQG